MAGPYCIETFDKAVTTIYQVHAWYRFFSRRGLPHCWRNPNPNPNPLTKTPSAVLHTGDNVTHPLGGVSKQVFSSRRGEEIQYAERCVLFGKGLADVFSSPPSGFVCLPLLFKKKIRLGNFAKRVRYLAWYRVYGNTAFCYVQRSCSEYCRCTR